MKVLFLDVVGRRGAGGCAAGVRGIAGAGAVALAAVLALGALPAQAAESDVVPPKAAEVATLRALLALQYPDLRRRPMAAVPIRSELSGNTSQGAAPQPDSPVL